MCPDAKAIEDGTSELLMVRDLCCNNARACDGNRVHVVRHLCSYLDRL